MIPVNPGNLLPFYAIGYSANDLRWQRHRLPGQDVIPYGLPCPRTRLMPFQVTGLGSAPTPASFGLFSPEDDSELVNLDVTLLTVNSDGTRWWVTWYADEDLDVVPDCGYWYVFLNLGESAGQYVSEVLYCQDFCGFEVVGLEIEADSCAVDGGTISFSLLANVYAGSVATWNIQRKTGLEWVTVSSGSSHSVSETLSNESVQFRIQVTTPCDLIITQTYTITWDSADGCGTLDIGTATTSTNQAGILSTGPVWRLNFSNTTDKANVLYQNNYEQYLYLPMPIWDVPEVERETDIRVNGNGEEIRRFTRTVERRGFETPDIPDYVMGWLSKAGDLNTITFEDAKLVDSLVPVGFAVENLTFVSPERQGTALNVGRFFFEVEAEAFQGCQENFELV
jgi:hypothetical protein